MHLGYGGFNPFRCIMSVFDEQISFSGVNVLMLSFTYFHLQGDVLSPFLPW